MDRFRFDEQSTGAIEFDIVDRNDDPVPASSLSAATLTLFDWETGAGNRGGSPAQGVINSRDAQDVLNDNNVSISAEGHVVWTVQPEDNVIVTYRRHIERHRAMFTFTWSGGSFNYECELEVMNLRKAV